MLERLTQLSTGRPEEGEFPQIKPGVKAVQYARCASDLRDLVRRGVDLEGEELTAAGAIQFQRAAESLDHQAYNLRYRASG